MSAFIWAPAVALICLFVVLAILHIFTDTVEERDRD